MSAAGGPSSSKPLENFRVSSLPPEMYYIPNFISAEEEASVLQKIPSQRWITLSHRRLQAHPSTLTKSNSLISTPLPSYLTTPIIDRFKELGIFSNTPHKEPNHVLINEYKKGEGIMMHEDGSAYATVVATVSLGASICLDIARRDNREEAEKADPTDYALPTRILQEPRSLLITMGSAYTDILHGISPVQVDVDLNAETVANWSLLAEPGQFEDAGGQNVRSTRVSLTYRDVLKVSSAASKILGGLGRR